MKEAYMNLQQDFGFQKSLMNVYRILGKYGLFVD